MPAPLAPLQQQYESDATVASDALDLSDPDVSQTIVAFNDRNSPMTWFLLTYVKNSNRLKLVGSGTDSLDEMTEELDNGKAMYGLFRFKLNEERTKIVYLTWVPDGVPTVIKGSVNLHAGQIAKTLKVRGGKEGGARGARPCERHPFSNLRAAPHAPVLNRARHAMSTLRRPGLTPAVCRASTSKSTHVPRTTSTKPCCGKRSSFRRARGIEGFRRLLPVGAAIRGTAAQLARSLHHPAPRLASALPPVGRSHAHLTPPSSRIQFF